MVCRQFSTLQNSEFLIAIFAFLIYRTSGLINLCMCPCAVVNCQLSLSFNKSVNFTGSKNMTSSTMFYFSRNKAAIISKKTSMMAHFPYYYFMLYIYKLHHLYIKQHSYSVWVWVLVQRWYIHDVDICGGTESTVTKISTHLIYSILHLKCNLLRNKARIFSCIHTELTEKKTLCLHVKIGAYEGTVKGSWTFMVSE